MPCWGARLKQERRPGGRGEPAEKSARRTAANPPHPLSSLLPHRPLCRRRVAPHQEEGGEYESVWCVCVAAHALAQRGGRADARPRQFSPPSPSLIPRPPPPTASRSTPAPATATETAATAALASAGRAAASAAARVSELGGRRRRRGSVVSTLRAHPPLPPFPPAATVAKPDREAKAAPAPAPAAAPKKAEPAPAANGVAIDK